MARGPQVPLTTQPHSPIRCGVSGPSNTTDPNMAGYRWSAPSSARALVAKVDDAGADRRDRDPPPAAQTSRIRRNRICGLTGRGLADPYYAVTQRDMPLSEAPIRIARRAEPVPQSIPVCLSRNLGRCAGADISPRDPRRRQYHQRPKHTLSPPITSLLRFMRSPPLTHAVSRHVSRFMDN